MQLCMNRLAIDGYGYTGGYGSGRVVILSTGRVRVRVTVQCYEYGSGSKTAVPADPYCRPSWKCDRNSYIQQTSFTTVVHNLRPAGAPPPTPPPLIPPPHHPT